MQDLKSFKTNSIKGRAAVIASILFVIALAAISIPTRIGGMIAELTSESDMNAGEIADFAHSLAPGDPETNGLLAATAVDASEAAARYERTVRLAPADHRWRVALGRAYEQAGRLAEAEGEFREAVRLAPAYAFPHWHLGNFYLRQGREAEAVAELKKAGEDHYSFRDQVFSLAWDYFDGDPRQVERVAADKADAKAYLSKFLAARGAADRSLAVWNQLDAEDKEKYRAVGRWAVLELVGKANFAHALEISRQLGDTTAEAEKITDPSFESPIGEGEAARFGWALGPGEPRVETGFDSKEKHTGSRSFRIEFRNYGKQNFASLFQTVVVRPNREYVLRFRVRTDGLRAAGVPMVQVVNAANNSQIAVSEPFEPDSPEWTLASISFRTPPDCTAINIRTIRSACGESCAITGTLWYDDFELNAVDQPQ